MTPYYQDDAVTIYHGDCREIVPQLGKFDLLLTDPPYGIDADNRKRILSRSKLAKAIDYGDSQWDKVAVEYDLIELIRGVCKWQIIWGGNYYPLPPKRGWFFWDKENGGNDFADGELAWTNLHTAVRKFNFRWSGMLQGDMASKELREHPTQKPTPLMTWCITKVPESQTILDPFAGSGTTGRAAKDLGRKATLIEREEKYCEIAAKRMSQEVFKL